MDEVKKFEVKFEYDYTETSTLQKLARLLKMDLGLEQISQTQ